MENKKNSKLKTILTVVIFIALISIIAWLGYGYYKKNTLKIANPIVTMEVEDYGTIKIELYPDKAPNTVKNFIQLINKEFYNGTKFHRVIKDFMIQGGDSNGDGTGKATLGKLYGDDNEKEYTIKGEMNANGYTKNDLNLTEGVIAMARADYTNFSAALAEESYNSAGTQFFIMTTNEHTNLSGYYAGFGKVIEGMDVVKKIAEVEVKASSDNEEDSENSEKSVPVKDVKVSKVTVDTFGVDYGMPDTLEPFNLMNWYYGLSN